MWLECAINIVPEINDRLEATHGFLEVCIFKRKRGSEPAIYFYSTGIIAQETRGDQSKQITKLFTSPLKFVIIVECYIPSYTAENSAFMYVNSTSLKGFL